MKDESITIISLTALTLGRQALPDQNGHAAIHSLFEKDKRAVVRSFVQPGKKNEDDFWINYDAFEQKFKKLQQKKNETQKKYEGELNVESAAAATSELLDRTATYIKFYTRWFKSFKKIIGGKKALAFFRLQITLQTIQVVPAKSNEVSVS